MTAPITAVLVLYRVEAEASPCFQSLRRALLDLQVSPDAFSLLLYDNSPEPAAATPQFPAMLRYLHDAANGGVAAAYNAGLDVARGNGSSWLLLLDQDTALTTEYLRELLALTESVPEQTVAIIPRLMQDGMLHSPQRIPRLSHRPLPTRVTGLLPLEVTAFNSGAAIRVSALGRFPEHYWLDFLDHAVFHELQAHGGKVWLMDAELQHSLSTERLGTDASLDRYRNVVLAERDFYSEYGSFVDRLFHRLRRLKQTAGQLLKVPDKRFALLSARAAFGLLGPTPPRPVRSSAGQASSDR